MAEITPRQEQLLKAIVEEYIESASPVGSEMLEKKYSFGVSPATIRNEMVILTNQGLLGKPHSSAGRVPTPLGFRYFIAHLMKEDALSVTEEVKAKERIWDWRHDFNRLLKETTRSLAEQSGYLALATTDEGEVYHAGYARILDVPEFFDIDVTKAVLSILEEFDSLRSFFTKIPHQEVINILLGEELGGNYLDECGLIYTRFETPRHQGNLGLIGPKRFDYPRVIPMVRYYGELLGGILKDW